MLKIGEQHLLSAPSHGRSRPVSPQIKQFGSATAAITPAACALLNLEKVSAHTSPLSLPLHLSIEVEGEDVLLSFALSTSGGSVAALPNPELRDLCEENHCVLY